MTTSKPMHTLITLLGKGRSDIATGYRNATCAFADGSEATTPCFGLALTRLVNREPAAARTPPPAAAAPSTFAALGALRTSPPGD